MSNIGGGGGGGGGGLQPLPPAPTSDGVQTLY